MVSKKPVVEEDTLYGVLKLKVFTLTLPFGVS